MKSLQYTAAFWLVLQPHVLASITIEDPSDVIDPQLWAADNAIIPDYNVPFEEFQPSPSKVLPVPASIIGT